MKRSILIADDEPDIREFLGYYLMKKGFEVFLAENGSEAVQCASITFPDLILLDLMMPEMNGYEAARLIRENSRLNDSKIVIFSAMSESLALTAGHHIFINDYIEKPASPQVILNRINTLIGAE